MKRLFFYLLILVNIPIVAQDKMVLSLEEAIEIGIDNNILLKQENNNLIINEQSALAGKLATLPTLNFRGQAWKTHGNQFIEQEARVVQDAQTNSIYGGIGANWRIVGVNNLGQIRQTSYELQAQQRFVERTKQDIINQIATQYIQVLLDQELLAIEQSNYEYQKKLFDQITEQVSLGSKPMVDQKNQESQMRLSEYNMQVSEATLMSDKAILLQTLLLDPSGDIVLQPLDTENIIIEEKENLANLISFAEENRKDLDRVEMQEKAASASLMRSYSGMLPSVDLFASYGSRYTDATVATFNAQISDNSRLEYGLQLSIPIFNGFSNAANMYKAKIQHENALLEMEQTKNQIKGDVVIASQNMSNAINNLTSANAQFTAAEAAYTLNKESFELGLISIIEFSLANRNYLNAQNSLTQAKYNVMFRKVMLEFATGESRYKR